MPHGKNLDEARSGGARKGKTGDNLDQSRQGGGKTKASGSKFDQNPNNRTNKSSGDHLNEPRARVAGTHTAERGGHSRTGHDKANPTKAKSKSGSKFDQHPSLQR